MLDKETPLPSDELAEALIQERIRSEKRTAAKKQQENGEIYQPKVYAIGDKVQFPAMDWINGTVTAVREGNNPEHPQMKVITVELSDGKTRQFAAGLENHILNTTTLFGDESESDHSSEIVDLYSDLVTQKLEHALLDSKDLIRIGAVWFAKSLLIEFNVGHLNLAEALLDMHNGGPLPVSTLLEQIDIETDDPQDLIKIFINYALQEDPRFDEVGPTGEIQWFLNRLEPQPVREIPIELNFTPIEYDRSDLDDDMLRQNNSLTMNSQIINWRIKKVTAKRLRLC